MDRILLLDNYDSFTFNLVHHIESISTNLHVDVYRNDEIALEDVDKYRTIVISPGPGLPADAGILKEVIKKYAPSKKMLGVCLGHQAIGEVFGAKLKNLDKVLHGVDSDLEHSESESPIFRNVPRFFKAGHYHSWVLDRNTIPDVFEITARDTNGEVMAISHRSLPVHGLQFHPESILTPWGKTILKNFFFSY